MSAAEETETNTVPYEVFDEDDGTATSGADNKASKNSFPLKWIVVAYIPLGILLTITVALAAGFILKRDFDQEIQAVWTKLDSLDSSSSRDQIELEVIQRISELESKYTNITAKFSELESDNNIMETKISEMENNNTEDVTKLSQLESNVADLVARLSILEFNSSQMVTELSELRSNATNQNESAIIESRITELEERINTNDVNISSINSSILILACANEVPIMSENSYNFSVDEGIAIGTEVGSVSTLCGRNNTIFVFGQTGGSPFVFNQTTGSVRTSAEIDREALTSSTFTFIVYAERNCSLRPCLRTSNISLIIHINNINDNAPVFDKSSYFAEVKFDTNVGAEVTTSLQIWFTDRAANRKNPFRDYSATYFLFEVKQEVLALDNDVDAQVSYSINSPLTLNGNAQFSISSTTGTISLSRTLNEEYMTAQNITQFNFLAAATDGKYNIEVPVVVNII